MIIMEASFLQWRSSMEKPEVQGKMGSNGDQIVRATTRSQRGRKSGSSTGKVTQKKQPQRGLGVAQLERLRLQERWKKMTQSDDHLQTQNLEYPFSSYLEQQPAGASSPFARRTNGEPVSYGDSGHPAFVLMNSQKLGNNGGAIGGGLGFRKVVPGRFELGQFAAKELSSTQRTMRQYWSSDHCEICFEKKKSNAGDVLGFEGGSNKARHHEEPLMPIINGCDFLGLSLGRKRPIIDGGEFMVMSKDFTAAGCSSGSPSKVEDQEVEVVAIHRKRNGVMGGGSVLMEYEFFPGCSRNSTSSSSDNKDCSVLVAEKITEEVSGGTNTNAKWLDLSLRLSC